ncbi:MAG: methionine--tRNA ligase subunit beta [Candidatus Omnitrophica bacterium]|nr:methionine--tRNA ligase subunit beta [Candidatus Omnitrophota bacterium]
MSEEQKPVENVVAAQPAVVKAVEQKPLEALVSIDDFKKFRIVVALIKEAALHPNADKLFVLKVDIGSEVRQVVAGIRKSYTPEQLVGKRVALIANLQPAVIRGVESQGMVLAASDDIGISVLSPDRADIAPGSQVK